MNNNSRSFEIRVISAQGDPLIIKLDNRPLVIGSSKQAGLSLNARFVSRRHALITQHHDQVQIVDLNSKNGTFLNGFRLLPNRKHDWKPGDVLSVGSARLELVGAPVFNHHEGRFDLNIAQPHLTPVTPAILTLNYDGANTQQVYFEGYALDNGLSFRLDPSEAFVDPGNQVTIHAKAVPSRLFFLGGTVKAEFSAFTTDGLFDSAEATMHIRPPYHLWLLLLLFLIAVPLLTYRLLSNPLPTGTPVSTEVAIEPSSTLPLPTAAPTETAVQGTSTNTSIPPSLTASEVVPIVETGILPTLTVLPTDTIEPVCFNQCAALGWQSVVVQPGDTLFGLAQSAGVSVSLAAQVNCIADPNILVVGQAICLPCVDSDHDGLCDQVDNCPTIANPDQADANGDSLGDACVPPFTLEWVTLPPSVMASQNAGCPSMPTGVNASVRASSGFTISEVTAQLTIDGRGTNNLGVSPKGGDVYGFDINIPGDAARGGDVNASVQVVARDSQGRTGTINTAFTVKNCPPPPTPAPRGLAVAWVQQLPGNMTPDNFYCPTTLADATAVARVTSDAGVDEVTASIDFADGSGGGTTEELPVEARNNSQFAVEVSLADLGVTAGSIGTLTLDAIDKKGEEKQLVGTVSVINCALNVAWRALPAPRVTANNALCPTVLRSTQGTFSVSVPGVIQEDGVTATVSGGAANLGKLPVTPLTGGQYRLTLDPNMLGALYTGPATIDVQVVDTRNSTTTLTAGVELADCTLRFEWVTLPDPVIAGSNATCPNIRVTTTGTLRASLPDAVSAVSADITVPPSTTPFALAVRTLGGGRYAVDVNAALLAPVSSAVNTIHFAATDIVGGTYDVTTSIQLLDCRGASSWVIPPPPQLAPSTCVGAPGLGHVVRFQVEVPSRVSPGAVIAEARNLTRGGAVTYPVSSVVNGQFEFAISSLPGGTAVNDQIVVRAFPPDHRETPFISTLIVDCPDAPVSLEIDPPTVTPSHTPVPPTATTPPPPTNTFTPVPPPTDVLPTATDELTTEEISSDEVVEDSLAYTPDLPEETEEATEEPTAEASSIPTAEVTAEPD